MGVHGMHTGVKKHHDASNNDTIPGLHCIDLRLSQRDVLALVSAHRGLLSCCRDPDNSLRNASRLKQLPFSAVLK